MKFKVKIHGAGGLPRPAEPAGGASAGANPSAFQPAAAVAQHDASLAHGGLQQHVAGVGKVEQPAHAPTHASVPKLIIKKRKAEDGLTAEMQEHKRQHTDNGQPAATAPLPSTSSAVGAVGGGGIKLKVKIGGVRQQPAPGHAGSGQSAPGFLNQINSGALGPPASQLQQRPGGFLQDVVAAGGALDSKQPMKAQEKARKAQEKAQAKAQREAAQAQEDMMAQVMGDAFGMKPKIKLKIKSAATQPAAAAPAPMGFGAARPTPAPGQAPLPSISSAPSISKPAPKLRIKIGGGPKPAGVPGARPESSAANGAAQPYAAGGISQLLEGLQDYAAGLHGSPPAAAAAARPPPGSASKARPRPGRMAPSSSGAVSRSAEKPPRPAPKRSRHMFDEDGDDLMDEDFDPRLLKSQRMPGEGRPSRGQPSNASAVGGARLFLLMDKVLEGVSKKDESQQNIFKAPVTDEIAPGYSEKIKNPMCFDMMRDKLRAGHYTSWALFEGDMRLVFDNAQIYNAQGSFVHHHASYLREVSQKYLAEAKRGNTNFRGVAAGITRKYMAEWFRAHPQQRVPAAVAAASQGAALGEARADSGALRDKKVRAGPSGAATAKERHTRQELQAQAAAQAAAQAYGRGLRQHANMSYAEDAPAQPRQARKGRRGQQVVSGVLRPVRAIDPDAKRMATVYVRRSELEELRDTYAPVVPAAQVPAAMWKGLSGGANAEGIDYATYSPWALRACWPGAIHTSIAAAWQAWQLHTAAAAAQGSSSSSTMGFMGAGLPLNSYAKSMARFIGRAHGAVRKAVLSSRLVGCMTVEGGQDPAALNPPAAGAKPGSAVAGAITAGLGGIAPGGTGSANNPGVSAGAHSLPSVASQQLGTGSQGGTGLVPGNNLSTGASSAFTGPNLQLPANLLAGLAAGLGAIPAGAIPQPTGTSLNQQASGVQPAGLQQLLQQTSQQQRLGLQQLQAGTPAPNLLLPGQQQAAGQLPSQLLQQQQQLLRQAAAGQPPQAVPTTAALQGLQGPGAAPGLQPGLGLQANAILQGLRQQPGLPQAQPVSGLLAAATGTGQTQQGGIQMVGGVQQQPPAGVPVAQTSLPVSLQGSVLPQQASLQAAGTVPQQPALPASSTVSQQGPPVTGLDLLSTAALELGGRITPQPAAVSDPQQAQQPFSHTNHTSTQQQPGQAGASHAIAPASAVAPAMAQGGTAAGPPETASQLLQQALIEQPSERLVERVSVMSDSPSSLPDLPPASP